jgi:ComF family protein
LKNSFIKSFPLFHLLYPHLCAGCGSDVLDSENFLCLSCLNDLPHTHYSQHANNPIEKLFWGRVPITSGMCEFYFSKTSIVQNLIHELKYKGNKAIGNYCGTLMGSSMLNSNRFKNIDVIIPLPLFEKKEKIRGYNQAQILCEGIASVTNIPIISKNVIRKIPTETQTKKGRIQRWENVSETFSVLNPNELEGRHILLVDDVITTGATLEACGAEILKANNTKLSIATLAIATK